MAEAEPGSDVPVGMTAARQKWCEGLPFAGDRLLSIEEAKLISARLLEIDKRSGLLRWFLRAGWAAAAFAFTQLLLGGPTPEPGRQMVGAAFAGVGIALVVLGAFGTLGEIAFGHAPLWRYVFGTLVVMLVAGSTIESLKLLAAIGGGMGIIAGAAFFWQRSMGLRKEDRLVRTVRQDLARGAVWVFEGERPVLDPVDDEGAGADARHESFRLPEMRTHRLSLLPSSSLAVSVDGHQPEQPTILTVADVAGDGVGAADAPFAIPEGAEVPEGLAFRQRHLTSAEVAEIGVLLRREAKRMLGSGLVMFWGFGAAARFVDMWVREVRYVGLSTQALVSVCVVVIPILLIQYRHIGRIRADAREAKVVVIRAENEAGDDMVAEEWLPQSGVLWSVLGMPAAWRLPDDA
ncbi:MAG: hypothetical protein OXR73_35175 [Myxococcales bacterium]|nr:hypothetical protein [Myxococcales bacterium]